jgi:hypothetical protein
MKALWLLYALLDGVALLYLFLAVDLHRMYGTERARQAGLTAWVLWKLDVLTVLIGVLVVSTHLVGMNDTVSSLIGALFIIFTLLFEWLDPVFGEGDKKPLTDQPKPSPPPDQIDEDWVRRWTEQMDEASQEHLKQVLHESE